MARPVACNGGVRSNKHPMMMMAAVVVLLLASAAGENSIIIVGGANQAWPDSLPPDAQEVGVPGRQPQSLQLSYSDIGSKPGRP